MCRPDFFEVTYEINTWMDKDNAVDKPRAMQQWKNLVKTYKNLGFEIELIDPQPGLPDMVFTANGALVIDGKVALPRFKYAERASETKHFERWFKDNGYSDILLPQYDFEGEGDALVCGNLILAGYGFRSSLGAHTELATFFPGYKILSLKLVDPRFYHIDTCLTVLDDQTIAYFPAAFDASSQRLIKDTVPNVLEASEVEAAAFGLNTLSDGQNVVVSSQAASLGQQFSEAGFKVRPIEIDEFRKSGGGIKCLTLVLR